MRVLITGGAGFLGSHIAEHLLKKGDVKSPADLLLIDNLATGRRDNLANLKDVPFIEGTVADRELVDRAFDQLKPTHVIHSAAAFKDPNNWKEDLDTNMLGTAHVVQAAKRHDVSRFVYFQTALAYGRAKSPIKVETSYAPLLSYSISKAGGEYYTAISGLPWVSLRMANIYGPRLFTGPQPIFVKKLRAGDACTIVNTRRDFLDLRDFLLLMDEVMRVGGPVGAFNVASGRDVTIPQVFDMIVKGLGLKEGEYKPPTIQEPAGEDLNSLLLDPSLTTERFGWTPKISVADGTAALVEWYKANGVGETFTHFVNKPAQQPSR
jgi:UDP-glucose 4-epimerase